MTELTKNRNAEPQTEDAAKNKKPSTLTDEQREEIKRLIKDILFEMEEETQP